jgi:saccharopine dehydrogenase-like NADP-dependent oxidoreductase
MKALILGCGNIGSVAARDIADSMKSVEIVLADKSEVRAKEVAESLGKSNVAWMQLDTANASQFAAALKDSDMALGFLPGKLGYQSMKACIKAQRDFVDVSFMPENPMVLNTEARRADVTIVPDCGLAPGISNVLVGHAVSELDRVDGVRIMVGGLPEKPIPPLAYVITWSPESLIDEYTRTAKIVRGGKKVEVESLTGVEEMKFPGVGKLEAFYTDGLRTLLDTVPDVGEMWEKTLRYPGHAEKITLLKSLGLFEDRPINVDGINVVPRRLMAKLIGESLSSPEAKDIVVLSVDVSGKKQGKRTRRIYRMIDHYDAKQRVTAMARTTAYPASIVAQLTRKKTVREKGIVPPERLGIDVEFFKSFLSELKRRKIRIREEIVKSD